MPTEKVYARSFCLGTGNSSVKDGRNAKHGASLPSKLLLIPSHINSWMPGKAWTWPLQWPAYPLRVISFYSLASIAFSLSEPKQ